MKNRNPMDYLECDFYSVELHRDGKKYVHVYGYAYYCDDEPAVPDKYFRAIEHPRFYIPIENFPDYEDAYERLQPDWSDLYDFDEDECADYLRNYFGGEEYAALPYSEVTLDTPEGNYIDCKQLKK